jgi:hypothetical protein
MTLVEVLDESADELESAERVTSPGGVEWRRGGRPFAEESGTGVEFRLDPPIAAAALRTPDTSVSARGPEWVAFAPGELDPHAVDRARAWFAAAWRRAEAPPH